jgi:hypothetical protein
MGGRENLGMQTSFENIDAPHWPITVQVAGKSYRASYTVDRSLVYVFWCGSSKATPVGTSDPELTARRLARELITTSPGDG